ncbi:sensor histidine kinase [Coralloluteibacterium stylophorae]|uniref:histidine kinase n=1 Tax=Coralloluteibacterium stylophorae TaxID=1776034 RepID=A0A8J7VQ58_9GAMM|nr:sensor histidine kinase [Coralloluteibacterium stylophorae]MBS7457321.1 sensor histidine kinase [Coralloluteibacterium stylophorae]
MRHRIKNSLALVGSIAVQTFRGDAPAGAAMPRFMERLKAIGRAQDVLTGDGEVSAQLRELVERALEPHRGGDCRRFRIEGPDLRLPEASATALAMALHELATNALKYGALSRDDGCVVVRWWVQADGSGGELRIEWREQGGPPVVSPARRGFGSGLVERALAAELHGRCVIAFEPAGVVCEIRAPLPRVAG